MDSIHSPAVIAEVKRLLQLDMSIRAVACKVGISRNAVHRVSRGQTAKGTPGPAKTPVDPMDRIVPQPNAHISRSRCPECGCKYRGKVCYGCYIAAKVLK